MLRGVLFLILLVGCLAKPQMPTPKPPSKKIVNPGIGPEDLNGVSPEDKTKPENGEEAVEGDMIMPKGKGKEGRNRNAIVDPNMKWPKKDGKVIVPYVFDTSVTCLAADAIKQAMEDYAKYTCIRFVPKTTSDHYIRFFKGGGCYSMVGNMQQYYGYQEKQDISIGSGCEYKGTSAHEMMHAMGFQHEQSRPDRDGHVTIKLENVEAGKEHNFDKCSTSECTTQNIDYDYDSVMHYGRNYFSKNGEDTIIPADPNAQIGQRKGFSELDIKKLNKLYDCAQEHINTGDYQPPDLTNVNGQDCSNVGCLDKYSNCGNYAYYCQFEQNTQLREMCPTTCHTNGC